MSQRYYENRVPGARLWTGDMEVEHAALEQIRQVAALPILAGPVAVMPDVHLGKGATVGTEPQRGEAALRPRDLVASRS